MDPAYFISTDDAFGSTCQTLANKKLRMAVLAQASKLEDKEVFQLILDVI
jgi:hypothetical protein